MCNSVWHLWEDGETLRRGEAGNGCWGWKASVLCSIALPWAPSLWKLTLLPGHREDGPKAGGARWRLLRPRTLPSSRGRWCRFQGAESGRGLGYLRNLRNTPAPGTAASRTLDPLPPLCCSNVAAVSLGISQASSAPTTVSATLESGGPWPEPGDLGLLW